MARAMRRDAGRITFHSVVDPDPDEIYQDLVELEHSMGTYTKPIRFAKTTIIGDLHTTFKLQRDPLTGLKWDKWSGDGAEPTLYAKFVRKRGQTKILQRTWGPNPGAMYRAATSWSNWRATDHTLQFAAERMPTNQDGEPYWVYHQQPSGDDAVSEKRKKAWDIAYKAARNKMLQSPEFQKAALISKARVGVERANQLGAAKLKKHATEEANRMALHGALGGQVRRAFFGPSKEAEEKIVKAFDGWANSTVEFFYTSRKSRRWVGVKRAR